MTYRAPSLPKAFIWRRIHSLAGLGLVIYLMEHLLTNSQAALFVGDNGSGFVTAVNSIQNLPYLPFIEIALVAIPFLIHGLWGIQYLLSADFNSYPTNGIEPSLPKYSRNHAYTWQRITSWLLIIGVLAHVIHMRFLEYPASAQRGTDHFYMIPVSLDNGLYTLSRRLGFEFYHLKQIQAFKEQIRAQPLTETTQESTPEELIKAQEQRENQAWLAALEQRPIKEGQVLAVSKSFGLAELLMVRDTFKDPSMIAAYSIFVIAACFHAFNGLWTWMITWGVTLTAASQRIMRTLSTTLMLLFTFLGLAAIWGTYWFNLKQ
jgi:succinate dehydrogenase / fumarate reductase cytochrome b subunit